MSLVFRLFLLGSFFLGLNGCIKETKVIEKRISPARKADADISKSLSLSSNTVVSVSKASLGDAFLLFPNAKASGRTPQWSDFKPLIVSFERSGNKLGLFKLTTDNLYSDIPSDNLMQTFEIVKETDNEITFDWSVGLNSLALSSSFEIYMKEEFEESLSNQENGIEDGLQIKNSFIRAAQIKDNRLEIEQVSRLSMDVPDKIGSDGSAGTKNVETTVTFNFQLRPYVESQTFNPGLFDKEQRIGAFLNFAHVPGQDLPTPFVMKWDISPEAGPIYLVIASNTPSEIAQTIIEAGNYWNMVFGRQVFVGKISGTSGDLPKEREMVVRWINWESAGFAYASAQADPLTGEILKAQVFLTSSWYSHGKSVISKEGRVLKGNKESEKLHQITRKNALCVIDQKEYFDELGLDLSNDQLRQKVALDTVRDVVAHEMGHALGMRHNFAGSLRSTLTDTESEEASKSYVKDINHRGAAYSSSVMDYTNSVGSALTGAYLKVAPLSYDQSYIDFIYHGNPIAIEKYQYCSDEHIMMANAQEKTIYGCDRFDALRNPINGELQAVRSTLDNMAKLNWRRAISDYENPNPYAPIKDQGMRFEFPFIYNLAPILFLADGVDFEPLVSIQAAINSSADSEITSDPVSLSAHLSQDFEEIGGVLGVINRLLPNEKERVGFFSRQAEKLIAQLNRAEYPFLSDEKYEQLTTELLETAKKSDAELVRKALASLLPLNDYSYFYSSMAGLVNPEEPTIFKYRDELNVSVEDLKTLFTLTRQNLITRAEAKSVTVYGKELSLAFEDESTENYSKFMLVNYVNPKYYDSNLPSDLFVDEKNLLVGELAKSTLMVLKAAGIEPSDLSYESLLESISKLDESRLVNVDRSDLLSEISIIAYLK